MEAADFWNDPEVSQKKMKELKSMKDDVATYASLTTQFEDIETLNGFLIDQLGHLPEDNEEIEIIYQGYSFKSVDIHDNMIRQVKVEKRKRKEEKDVRTQ